MRRGFLNTSIALILLLFSGLIAILIAGVMKEVIDANQQVMKYIDNSYSKLIVTSSANAWAKYLTVNGGFWNDIHSDILDASSNKTVATIDNVFTLKVSLSNAITTYKYTVASTSTAHVNEQKFVSVSFDTLRDNTKLQLSANIEFGWRGL